MSLKNSSSVPLCIFCYKKVNLDNPADKIGNNNLEVVKRFLKLLNRFTNHEPKLKLKTLPLDRENLSCCSDCCLIVRPFCQVFHEMKCLELELERKLEKLVRIMKLANRVPGRLTDLKQLLEKHGNEQLGEVKTETQIKSEEAPAPVNSLTNLVEVKMQTVKTFRHNIVKRSKNKLSSSLPRVFLQRIYTNACTGSVVNTGKHNCRSFPEGVSDNTDFSDLRGGLGWIFSLTAVAMLSVQNTGRTISVEQAGIPVCSFQNLELEQDLISSLDAEDDASDELPFLSFDTPGNGSEEDMGMDVVESFSPLPRNRSPDKHFEVRNTPTPDPVSKLKPDAGSNLVLESTGSKETSRCVTHQVSKSRNRRNSVVQKKKKLIFKKPTKLNKKHRCEICKVTFRFWTSLQEHKRVSKSHRVLLQKWIKAKRKSFKLPNAETSRKKGTYRYNVTPSKIPLPTPNLEADNDIIMEENTHLLKSELDASGSPPAPVLKSYNLRCRKSNKRTISKERDYQTSASEKESDTEFKPNLDALSGAPIQNGENCTKLQKSDDSFSSTSSSSDTDSDTDHEEARNLKVKRKQKKPLKSSILRCPIPSCPKRFGNKFTQSVHVKQHGTWTCQFCPKVLNLAEDLAEHEREHATNDPSIRLHLACPDKPKSVLCPRCPQTFRHVAQYKDHHLKAHLDLKLDKLKCSICDLEFGTKNLINGHIKHVHGGARTASETGATFKCTLCSGMFQTAYKLHIHQTKVHLTKTCEKCGKRFYRKGRLRDHLLKYHPEVNLFTHFSFKCDVLKCGKQFTRESDLANHKIICQREIEARKEVFTCDKCGKDFPGERRLKQHISSFHSEKLHICDQCGKVFRKKVTLQEHKKYHLGPEQWKFQCEECGRKFADKQKLSQHERVHTQEKPYVCQYCGAKYAHRHNWRNHMKTKHPEDFTEETRKLNGNFMSRKGSKKGECIVAGTSQK